jgi:hypothetical protein
MSPPQIFLVFLRQAGKHTPRDPTHRSRDLEEIVPKMRKRIIARPLHSPPPEQGWLDLESTASVEVTSEDSLFPIESALLRQGKGGWRAAEPGVQTIRLIFDQPQRLRRVSVVFEETETVRAQEFTLRWSPDRGSSFREIVRQQWNFSSPDATRESEEYNVDLPNVTLLDLVIDPDRGNGKAQASLLSLRLA